MLVKVANLGTDGVGIKCWPAERAEIGDQASVFRSTDAQSRRGGDPFVDAGADESGFSQEALEPRSIGLSHTPAGSAHQKLDEPLHAEADRVVYECRWSMAYRRFDGASAGRSAGRRGRRLRFRRHGELQLSSQGFVVPERLSVATWRLN